MTIQEEKDLQKKEQKLKKREKEAIIEKSKFIMKYSNALLEKIKSGDEEFLKTLIVFLMADIDDDFVLNCKPNRYNYYNSLSVIFEICFKLPLLGFNSIEQENIRNKIRLYTKHFKESYNDSKSKIESEYILIDDVAYNSIVKKDKKYLINKTSLFK